MAGYKKYHGQDLAKEADAKFGEHMKKLVMAKLNKGKIEHLFGFQGVLTHSKRQSVGRCATRALSFFDQFLPQSKTYHVNFLWPNRLTQF